MKHSVAFLIPVLLAGTFCLSCSKEETEPLAGESYTQYVDPLTGSGGHGHVFVGANVPFGMVQAGPVQYNQGWDWCSGYHYSDSTVIGFAQMHLSGTGIGDLGDISFMPVATPVQTTREGLCAKFLHKNEHVRPGYYSVLLEGSGIKAELTATARVAFHKYTYPTVAGNGSVGVVIDLEHGIGWDAPQQGHLAKVGARMISGYRKSKGWAKEQAVFFKAEFSVPFTRVEWFNGTQRMKGDEFSAEKAYATVWFDLPPGGVVMFKVGLSPVSEEKAAANLSKELPGWDFEAVVAAADSTWNNELSKIIYETIDPTRKQLFYTALYHTMTAPSVFCDYDLPDGFTRYTTFSLWDTYRAAHPLATLIHSGKMEDYALTMLDIFDKQGKLPVWHLMGNETDCMVGNPGIPVLADIVLKGCKVDKQRAYNAMKTSAMLDERGMKWLKEYGYIPFDKDSTNETVAKTLEYALADWCVARVAEQLGNTADAEYFDRRAKAYTFLFDPNTRFMRARSSEGTFREPFNPFHSSHRIDDYTEGNAWQYTWLVPHDIQGLTALFGGPGAFVDKLDSLFVVQGDLGEDASPDISGLIGQYAHGNEPSHHIAYMYACAGYPYKTAEKVRQILTTLYHNGPDGLSGNEDVGQMSAWYVLSAIGLYQVEPAGGRYVFGSPLMDKAVLRVGEGRTFTILARNNRPGNYRIKSARLNGKPYNLYYINHSDIMAGGILEFDMGE